MSTMNKLSNCKNKFQGTTKKVLCICSAGLLRSPTAAVVLSQEPFNFNTRAAGINSEYALIDVDDVLMEWADEFVVMESWMSQDLDLRLNRLGLQSKDILCLNIPDEFAYRDPNLMQMISDKYKEVANES